MPIAAALPLYETYLPVALLVLAALAFALGTIVTSTWIFPWLFKRIKPRKSNTAKLEPYECGIPAVGSARSMIFVRFYLVALLFLLFDMETIFIVAWALVYRGSLGSPAAVGFLLAEMAVFLGVLLAGYLYAWKKGALSWS